MIIVMIVISIIIIFIVYGYDYLAGLVSDHLNENYIQDNLGIGLGQSKGAEIITLVMIRYQTR